LAACSSTEDSAIVEGDADMEHICLSDTLLAKPAPALTAPLWALLAQAAAKAASAAGEKAAADAALEERARKFREDCFCNLHCIRSHSLVAIVRCKDGEVSSGWWQSLQCVHSNFPLPFAMPKGGNKRAGWQSAAPLLELAIAMAGT
jgi:hypothetical protein